MNSPPTEEIVMDTANIVPKTLADTRLEAKIAIERLIKATVEEGKETVLILGLESYVTDYIEIFERNKNEQGLIIKPYVYDWINPHE